MSIAILTIVLVAGVVTLLSMVMKNLVCPYCESGPIRRAGEKTKCDNCGKYFYLWQARRKSSPS